VIEENGRLYHSFQDGKYVLPSDEREQDRLDLQNHLFSLTLEGRLSLAPIGPNPQHVLDIGTGTGTVPVFGRSTSRICTHLHK
jgi:hypothetical protein